MRFCAKILMKIRDQINGKNSRIIDKQERKVKLEIGNFKTILND